MRALSYKADDDNAGTAPVSGDIRSGAAAALGHLWGGSGTGRLPGGRGAPKLYGESPWLGGQCADTAPGPTQCFELAASSGFSFPTTTRDGPVVGAVVGTATAVASSYEVAGGVVLDVPVGFTLVLPEGSGVVAAGRSRAAGLRGASWRCAVSAPAMFAVAASAAAAFCDLRGQPLKTCRPSERVTG